ncbi:bifunctional serine/threonine-protein kinase/glutamate ABC transporter substrate-binding protein [Streptomyces sp. NPDC058052]|uniref:bifunctional serine/threonine-protein kinase/glutamate ABC transporter substrate-binding protein n=1 Tax=Streptomyces sp. NPDC058052 TaxID=3346316 RepID=UPI0036EDE6E6
MARVVDGRFELVGRLGGGGMGLVWRARDRVLHREVALKEVRPSDPGLAEYDPAAAAALTSRVLREARALARLTHPNVVTIHHVVEAAGAEAPYPWIVMELVTGGSLQDRLDRGPLAPAEAASLGRGLLAGLRAAHAAGIQHRDVKPPNVLLRPDGTPVLTDFGIASLHGATALTPTGAVIGTPEYMSPERVRGEDGGPAADLWSLAMTLYVAVEGGNPFRRSHTLATLAAVLAEEVPPPHRAGPLGPVLMAVLVRDPAARPDAAHVDRLLAEVAGGGARSAGPRNTGPQDAVPVPDPAPTSYRIPPPAPATPPATPPAAPPAVPRPGRRKARVLLAAGVALALTGGGITWALWPKGDADRATKGTGGTTTASSPPATTSSSPPAPTSSSPPETSTSPSGGGGRKITIGIKADQPGFSVRSPDGRYAGFDVDVATYVARALKYDPADIVWKEVASSERETALGDGTVDMVVATYAITDRREGQVDFAGPYLVAHQDVLVRDGDTSVRSAGDLAAKRVCSALGSSSSATLRGAAPGVVVQEFASYQQCVEGLVARLVEGVTTDDALLAGYAAQPQFGGMFRLAGLNLSQERYGIGLPQDSPLRDRVQAALTAMVADGAWATAMRTHLPLLDPDPSALRR